MKKILKFILFVVLFVGIIILGVFCGTQIKNGNMKNIISTVFNNSNSLEYYFNTNVPTLKSALNYKTPIVYSDVWNIQGEYYETFSKNDFEEYSSNIEPDKDYKKYNELLIAEGFSLMDSFKDGNITTYIYRHDTITVEVHVSETSFGISIKKE